MADKGCSRKSMDRRGQSRGCKDRRDSRDRKDRKDSKDRKDRR